MSGRKILYLPNYGSYGSPTHSIRLSPNMHHKVCFWGGCGGSVSVKVGSFNILAQLVEDNGGGCGQGRGGYVEKDEVEEYNIISRLSRELIK